MRSRGKKPPIGADRRVTRGVMRMERGDRFRRSVESTPLDLLDRRGKVPWQALSFGVRSEKADPQSKKLLPLPRLI